MDSVDDSIIGTPADTSNLSTPASSSSEISQPTVKLRANVIKDPLKCRKSQRDVMANQNHSLDNHQPFLQTLDHDGRLLVETTGRTAQRARASIRQSSRLNENSWNQNSSMKSNDRHWPEHNYEPRKSRSTTSVHDKNINRRIRQRHYSYGMEPSRRSWETLEIPKRYSAGDYLRQQILEDLSSNELIGKTEEQIAEDRCNRVKAYLRRRNVDSSYVYPEDKLRELRNCWKSEGIERTNDSISVFYNAARRNDLDRIRAYLQDQIQRRMNEDEWKRCAKERSSMEYPNELSVQDIRQRYSEHRRVNDRDYSTRRVRNDINVRRQQEMILSSESDQDEENYSRTRFLRSKSKHPREYACRRTRSNVIPETVIDPEDYEIRKRFYSYTAGYPKSWQTRSCLTFEKKLSLPSHSFMNLDQEPSSPSALKNDWTNEKGKNRKKCCHRSRSDTLPEKIIPPNISGRRTKRRSVSWSDKRKLHRRTSEKLAAVADETSLDSDGTGTSNMRRTKIQQGNLCSWREYKEKRRQERLLKESVNVVADDENIRKICLAPVIWKNLSQHPSNIDEPEVHLKRESRDAVNCERINEYLLNEKDSNDPATKTSKEVTSTNENITGNISNVGDTTEDTETETILQENYLLLERNAIEKPNHEAGLWSPTTISKLQVNEYRDPNLTFNYEFNMVDFGYDTIPKKRGNNGDILGRSGWIDINGNSRVKKTDTFKIVDGSEDALNEESQKRGLSNFDATLRPLMNDLKSSLDEENFGVNTNDPVINSHYVVDRDPEISTSCPIVDNDNYDDAVSPSNKDVARDYFKRVYELLKQRQDRGKRKTPGLLVPLRYDEDTSSSNYPEQEEDLRRRRRRRKKDKSYQGEELVAVSPGVDEEDDWPVQKFLVNDNSGGNLIFRRPQLQNVTGQKRPRHPAPPIPANCKINAKDISQYFDYPNKENSSPSNGVIENKNRIERKEEKESLADENNENEMGSNLSRHNGKGLTGRRTQSSGNLCDPKGKLNHVGKILVPCSSSQRERYKICGSLPNHLDDKEMPDEEDPRENNNVISDTMVGNLGGTLPHKKRALGVHFSDTGPTGTLDLVKHRSQDSLEGDPWRYQDGVDLDLVRCKHGNFDLVRKNPSADTVDGDGSSRRYAMMGRTAEVKCHHSADLDLVGALPKRKPGDTRGARQNRSIDRIDGDLLMKVTHKPDCELMKHRQLDRAVDLKLSRLIGGEPQDQGYASERSPEDEHPPSLPGQHFPNVTPESTFRVTLQKSSRGLGLSVSGGGAAGPVRVKRLFPQQPAALSNKLQSGDILLAANGVPLTGLTNYEALEVLRTTSSTVELVVCRLPGDASITPPGAPPPPPARREPPPSLRILNPLPPLQIEPCGEFDIEMTKVAGSLGFTLRKVDSSALGHYVRALVREPALSDGRIQPGDKIVAVDGATLSPMSHEEAVALLRQCGPRVKLRLYRDLAQTPVSALSPTEPDHPLRPPRTSLRQEAVDMLCDLAVRKLSPGTSNGSTSMQTSGASSNSPRRLRRPPSRTPTADNEHENPITFHPVNPSITIQTDGSETDQCSIKTQPSNSQSETPLNDIIDPPPLYDVCDSSDSSKFVPRPSFLNLGGSSEKSHFQFNIESNSEYTGPTIVTESDSNLTCERDYEDNHRITDRTTLSSDEQDNNLPSEPASMPPLLSTSRTTSGVFSYKNPAYQSANPTCGGIDNSAKNKAAHSSDQDIPGKVLGAEDPVGSKGLLKWKGVMFAPDDDVDEASRGKTETEDTARDSTKESAARQNITDDGSEVFMVELTRGWNSRLGFSLQPEGNSTVISVVHPDSVAAKDGRLKQGDVLIMVNDESVENVPTAEIIDLLRKIRGSIGITVMRKNKMKTVS